MASENNDISDIVKKCKILLLDIEGTTTSISFVKDKLFPYAEANVKEFLENQWEDDEVKEVVAGLRKLAIEDQDNNVEGVVTIPGEEANKEEQIVGLVQSVLWLMGADRKTGPLKQLQGLIWKNGYDKGDIKGHVYDDVAPALQLWRSIEGQKVYIYSSGSVQAQKLLFNFSVVGDLLTHIDGHFDTAIGAKQEAASYSAIAEKLGCKPEEILFLTDIVKEAEAARASGLYAALVSREGNAPLPTEATTSYPVLQTFDQLTVTNKRKPDPQEEEVPAKVPKTDIEADVKTAVDMEVANATSASETETPTESVADSEKITKTETDCAKASEPEKMEVEEESTVETATVKEPVESVTEKVEKESVRIETQIEEITDSNEVIDTPIADIEPVIIEESVEKTEKNETEPMETESTENVTVDNTIEPKEQEKISEESAPVAEETPPPAITIQDITNKQETINESEIIDTEPIVEEPSTVEMDELKNVGDVLEKECDEILSKVQDVTNLDKIPIKPLLNTILEEPIEVQNGENSNDIVESILDSEMELAEKPKDDVVKAPEITVTPCVSTEEKLETITEDETAKGEEKVIENISESTNDIETGVKQSVEVTKAIEKEDNNDENALPDTVTNGNSEEKKPDTEEKMETVTTTVTSELHTNDKKESNGTEENKVIQTNTEVVTTASENDKMETEDNTPVSVENKEENTNEPVENKPSQAINTKESKEVNMETKDKSELVENTSESVEDKTKTIDSIAEPVESTIETKEIVDSEMETAESNEKRPEKETDSVADLVESKTETKEVIEGNNKTEFENSSAKVEDKMESDESAPLENKTEENNANVEVPVSENKVDENKTDKEAPAEETEPKEKVMDDIQMETEKTEVQVNGKTNGDLEANLNGDASKTEELSARLSVENGENGKEMNGTNSNGDSSNVEKGQGDNKVEPEVTDIKIKTVATEEPRTDPIEQPVEA